MHQHRPFLCSYLSNSICHALLHCKAEGIHHRVPAPGALRHTERDLTVQRQRGQAVELKAAADRVKHTISAALGDAAEHVLINSTKSMVGHLLGAAGDVEAVVCAKSIQDGFVHQTIGTKETDEECDLNYCIGAPVETDVKLAMSNSLGFGGHNAVLLFRKYE